MAVLSAGVAWFGANASIHIRLPDPGPRSGQRAKPTRQCALLRCRLTRWGLRDLRLHADAVADFLASNLDYPDRRLGRFRPDSGTSADAEGLCLCRGEMVDSCAARQSGLERPVWGRPTALGGLPDRKSESQCPASCDAQARWSRSCDDTL
jgi:hypothetical protein